ncbi:DUF982 domain-containing protein [Pseudaminobacter salicylatoxidans]|uniref:DUF982 domain-containing protein n=1 Tax=Pseudaminobacter salicylatoxidans TaxID=93369 RepID=UPI0002FA7218|nr:DUF982 domain-containing protein [Pseudaminobacter salicylatoxidans]
MTVTGTSTCRESATRRALKHDHKVAFITDANGRPPASQQVAEPDLFVAPCRILKAPQQIATSIATFPDGMALTFAQLFWGDIMDNGWFDKPVPISLGIIGDIYNVSNARQAVDILDNRWPDAGTPKHRDARYTCLQVLQGLKKPEAARQAFTEAAREAGILFDDDSVDSVS